MTSHKSTGMLLVHLYPSILRVLLPLLIFLIIAMFLDYFISDFNVYLFVELLSILIAVTAMTVASTTIQFTKNHLVVFLAIVYGWCAGLDLIAILILHQTSGLSLQQANSSADLWFSARFLQAFAALCAPFFLLRTVRLGTLHFGLGLIFFALTAGIFTGYFPDANTFGLALFKSHGEFLIILMLMISTALFWHQRVQITKPLVVYLLTSNIAFLLSSLCYAGFIHLSLGNNENLICHVLNILTYWFIYAALVLTTLRQPFNMISQAAIFYDTIPDSTIIMQGDGLIYQANAAASTFTSLHAQALNGLSSHTLFHNAHILIEQCPVCSRLCNKHEPFTVEIERTPTQWIECSLTPIILDPFKNTWVQVMRDISVRKQLEEERIRLVHDLGYYVKELRCLYTISNLNTAEGATIENLLSETVLALPLAFQYPQYVTGRIDSIWGTFSSNATEVITTQRLEQEIIVDNEPQGVIQVFYHHKPANAAYIFFKEEMSLLNAVAKQLGDTISRILGIKKIQQLSYLYQMLSVTNHAAFHCHSRLEYLKTLFSAIREHGAFTVLFIAMKTEADESFHVLHYHGIATDKLAMLNDALSSKNGSITMFLNQLDKKKVINVSKNVTCVEEEWTKNLQALGIIGGYIIPLIVDKKIVGFIGAYSKSDWIAWAGQEALLNQIAADASFVLTGFVSNEQRLTAENNARVATRRFSEVYMAAPLPLQIISLETNQIKSVNKAFEDWLSYPLTDILSDKHWIQQVFGNNHSLINETWWRVLQAFQEAETSSKYKEVVLYDKLGNRHIALASVLTLEDEVMVFWIDLTEIRQKEALLQERAKHFSAIIEQAVVGIYVRDEKTFIYTNPRFCEIVGWSAEELVGKSLLNLVNNDDEETKQLILDKWDWFQQAQLPQSITIPIVRKNGEKIILGLHGTPITWDGKPAVLVITQDITERKRAQVQIEQYVNRLERAMNGTFHAISAMVELRDPYTAGHERRVGLIAKAIGRELAWPEEKCKSLELMGLIHDIGKISVPAEILVKPTQLSEMEMAIVRGHSETGYHIVKDIDFDNAPIAEVILQHHERMDGSGYPRGLKGDEILLETRVISVADVLESMSSHRPYRPALGIDAAIEELSAGRDTRYDPLVVDAVIRLIREKGYVLPV